MSNANITSAPQDLPMLFTDLGPRKVVADFSGGTLSTDAGALLLRQTDANLGMTPGLAGTELERATAGSLRLKVLKVAAQVRVSVRRVYVQLSSAYPLQGLFRLCHRQLMRLAAPTG